MDPIISRSTSWLPSGTTPSTGSNYHPDSDHWYGTSYLAISPSYVNFSEREGVLSLYIRSSMRLFRLLAPPSANWVSTYPFPHMVHEGEFGNGPEECVYLFCAANKSVFRKCTWKLTAANNRQDFGTNKAVIMDVEVYQNGFKFISSSSPGPSSSWDHSGSNDSSDSTSSSYGDYPPVEPSTSGPSWSESISESSGSGSLSEYSGFESLSEYFSSSCSSESSES